jgi:hypothetical protein
MTRASAYRRSASPYGLGSATTGARHPNSSIRQTQPSTTTDAKRGHFKPSRRGQRKPSFSLLGCESAAGRQRSLGPDVKRPQLESLPKPSGTTSATVLGLAMPRRTNVFQEVVAIIHEHMAEGATVEESAMLVNRATGHKREVDVVIRTNAATQEVVIGIEATSAGREASVEMG